jgi:hypothetical protein
MSPKLKLSINHRKNVDRDAGGSVVVKRRKMELTLSAAAFFRSIKEESSMEEVVGYFRKSIQVGPSRET